ncbi:hypothetical protein BB560_002074 [Smittium megazygosporum]|uniref:PH domain-containing protein n=1 Tax=Smittium megazygosporum TaxID=133381 RepID=A0A2T9ZFT1_9FUNG|nr:hypothetical protein BB560_002074 [Smittium megazygosporum]
MFLNENHPLTDNFHSLPANIPSLYDFKFDSSSTNSSNRLTRNPSQSSSTGNSNVLKKQSLVPQLPIFDSFYFSFLENKTHEKSKVLSIQEKSPTFNSSEKPPLFKDSTLASTRGKIISTSRFRYLYSNIFARFHDWILNKTSASQNDSDIFYSLKLGSSYFLTERPLYTFPILSGIPAVLDLPLEITSIKSKNYKMSCFCESSSEFETSLSSMSNYSCLKHQELNQVIPLGYSGLEKLPEFASKEYRMLKATTRKLHYRFFSLSLQQQRIIWKSKYGKLIKKVNLESIYEVQIGSRSVYDLPFPQNVLKKKGYNIIIIYYLVRGVHKRLIFFTESQEDFNDWSMIKILLKYLRPLQSYADKKRWSSIILNRQQSDNYVIYKKSFFMDLRHKMNQLHKKSMSFSRQFNYFYEKPKIRNGLPNPISNYIPSKRSNRAHKSSLSSSTKFTGSLEKGDLQGLRSEPFLNLFRNLKGKSGPKSSYYVPKNNVQKKHQSIKHKRNPTRL